MVRRVLGLLVIGRGLEGFPAPIGQVPIGYLGLGGRKEIIRARTAVSPCKKSPACTCR